MERPIRPHSHGQAERHARAAMAGRRSSTLAGPVALAAVAAVAFFAAVTVARAAPGSATAHATAPAAANAAAHTATAAATSAGATAGATAGTNAGTNAATEAANNAANNAGTNTAARAATLVAANATTKSTSAPTSASTSTPTSTPTSPPTSAAPSGPSATCEARAGTVTPTVVELYTSEGCSSCPPADRWLSGLKRRDDVLALSFHVNYWDRLGWVDRFASPAYTERQRALMAPSGARYVYTPQVIVDGADWRAWPGLPDARRPAPLDLHLQRDGAAWTAVLQPRPGQALPARLSAYWVQLEDGHRSDVRAGENAGEKLAHDHVVRQYQPVEAWPSPRGQRLQWTPLPPDARDARLPRRTALVIVDPATQRPVQALAAGC